MPPPFKRRPAAGAIGDLLGLGGAVSLLCLAVRANASAPAAIQGQSAELMVQRAHGTCTGPPQDPLRWGSSVDRADQICCFNRHYAEYRGYFRTTTFHDDQSAAETTVFYDSITGRPLFEAPIGRSFAEFYQESYDHGWPSFRDAEVFPDFVRVLEDGEVVSVDGTHLGHNLPDDKGNRYCINIVSAAGYAQEPTLAPTPAPPTPAPTPAPPTPAATPDEASIATMAAAPWRTLCLIALGRLIFRFLL